jgi:hypothetical protein
MSQTIHRDYTEADVASDTEDQKNQIETTVRLTPEGQQRLVNLVQDKTPRPVSPAMLRARELSLQLFGAPQ